MQTGAADEKSAELRHVSDSAIDLNALLTALDSSALISVSDNEGTITYVNDMFVRMSGYGIAELIGQNHRILKSGVHPAEFYDTMWKTIADGRVWRGEICNKSKDGTLYWADSSIAPIVGTTGKPEKYVSVRIPITERKNLEAELNARRRQQDEVANITALALKTTSTRALTDEITVRIRALLNADMAYVFRYIPEEGKLRLLSGSGTGKAGENFDIDADEVRSLPSYALRRGEPVVSPNLSSDSAFDADFEVRKCHMTGGVVVQIPGTGYPFGLVGVFFRKPESMPETTVRLLESVADIIANTQRRHVEKQKDEFINIASHELKTPLTSIKMFVQMLKKKLSENGDTSVVMSLSRIDSQINRLTDLINELLDISRINAGRLQYHDEVFGLDEVVSECVGTLQNLATFHQFRFSGETGVMIEGDRIRIGQVVENLLSNAVKFSPDAKTIDVKVGRDGKYATFSVEDFGIGVSEQDQDQLFHRFFQGEDTKRQQFPGGMGLGLYISNEIIKRYRGRIWLEPKTGPGSVFKFALPLAVDGKVKTV